MILERRVPGATTLDAPAIVLDPATGQFLVAWRSGTTEMLQWSRSSGAQVLGGAGQPEYNWAPAQPVALAVSDLGPTLAGFAGRAWIAWKAPGPIGQIMVSSNHGTIWTLPMPAGAAASDHAPCLAATDTALFLFWKAGIGDGAVLWSKSTDGQIWTPAQELPGSGTDQSPSACVGEGTLYVAWKGLNGDTRVHWALSSNGATWSAPAAVPNVATNATPAIASAPFTTMELVYRGSTDATAIWRTSVTNPAANLWETPTQVPTVATSASPSLASLSLLMAWTGLRNNLYVGPLQLLGNSSPPTTDAQTYRFTLGGFQIAQTRALHSDTDYASFTVAVGSKALTPQNKAMGALNNGNYTVGLTIDATVADNQPAVVSYAIVNAGHAPLTGIENDLVAAGTALAEEVASEIESAVLEGVFDGSVPVTVFEQAVPMIGSALKELADWLVQQLVDVLTVNCDGPVAAAAHGFAGQDLRAATASDRIMSSIEVNIGTPTPFGCNSVNSLYTVEWSVCTV
jgi:hypothetical protein